MCKFRYFTRLQLLLLSAIAFSMPEIWSHENKTGDIVLPSFDREILPLLYEKCVDCHSPENKGGALDLTTLAGILTGGEQAGPAIKPGDPENSPLIKYIDGSRTPTMPKGEDPLCKAEIELLKVWIAHGGVDDRQRYSSEQEHFFESTILPILTSQCIDCHGGHQQKSGLSLASRESVLKGGSEGPAVIPGKPEESLLLKAVKHQGDLQMPKGKPQLSTERIAALEKWIRDGLPWSHKTPMLHKGVKFNPTPEQRKHWAYQPLNWQRYPELDSATIDTLISTTLAARSIVPSPPAARQALLRRVYYDLTGLPPTKEQILDFLDDTSPNAFEKVVDRLLTSPHFAAQWARRWLDYARWGSKSCTLTAAPAQTPIKISFASNEYRAWVIKAFHQDMPYDQFLRYQIAGDLLSEPENRPVNLDGLVATNALFFGPMPAANNPNDKFAQADFINDQLEFIGRSMMGLSLECARCHDHKFEPISQRDYYAIFGILNSSNWARVPHTDNKTDFDAGVQLWNELMQTECRILEIHREFREALTLEFYERKLNDVLGKNGYAKVQEELKRFGIDFNIYNASQEQIDLELPGLLDSKLSDPEERKKLLKTASTFKAPYESWKSQRDKLSESMSSRGLPLNPPEVEEEKRMRARKNELLKQVEKLRGFMALTEGGPYPERQIADAPIYILGEVQKLGPVVPRRMPEFFGGSDDMPLQTHGSGRRELADWVASTDNPLTARAQVNRIWMYLFRRGIVVTPTDLGVYGSKPSHQELLDRLAADFIRDGWSLKKLVRKIVLTDAYARSSQPTPSASAHDPENRYYSRQTSRRLTAEEIHDGIAVAMQKIDTTTTNAQNKNISDIFKVLSTRAILGTNNEFNDFFDGAMKGAIEAQRNQSVVATQAMFLMNAQILEPASVTIAVATSAMNDRWDDRITYAYYALFSRAPTDAELSFGRQFIDEQLNYQQLHPVEPTDPLPEIVSMEGYQKKIIRPQQLKKAQFPDKPFDKAFMIYTHALLLSNEFLYLD